MGRSGSGWGESGSEDDAGLSWCYGLGESSHERSREAGTVVPPEEEEESDSRPQLTENGDGQRFPLAERESLYAGLQPLVRRLIRQYGDTYEMRQDLEGEIYCRFQELLDCYDPSRGVPLRAYLIRRLISSVYTFARSQWRRQRREVSLGTGDVADEGADPGASVLQWRHDVARRDTLSVLPEMIAALPRRQRQVIILRYYESRTHEEIAEVLGVCPATVRSLLRHGLNALRRQLNVTRSASGKRG